MPKNKKRKQKKTKKKRLTLADVQAKAEEWVLDDLRQKVGYKTLEKNDIPIGDDYFQPGGVTRGNRRIVEVCKRAGKLPGPQKEEAASAILKLAAIRQHEDFENARCEIYFVDGETLASVDDWMEVAARQFGVHLNVAEEFPPTLLAELLAAQDGQAKGKKKKK